METTKYTITTVIEIPISFEKYCENIRFSQTPISDFFNNYKNKPKFATKQLVTKWLKCICEKKGYELSFVRTNSVRCYYFKIS